MGFSVNKTGFTNINSLMASIAQDFLDGGFRLVYSDEVPEDVTVLLDTLLVYKDGNLVDSSEYVVNSTSPSDASAIACVEFLTDHTPASTVKTITADFLYLRDFKNAYDIPLLGKPSSLNNIFVTPTGSTSYVIDLSQFVLRIDGVAIDRVNYNLTALPTGYAQVEITNLELINPLGLTVTADYVQVAKTVEDTSCAGTTVSSAPTLENDILTISVPNPNNKYIVTDLTGITVPVFNKTEHIGYYVWFIDRTTLGYEQITFTTDMVTSLGKNPSDYSYLFTVDISGLSETQKDNIQYLVDNWNKVVEYKQVHYISNALPSNTDPLPEDVVGYATISTVIKYSRKSITTYTGYKLTGKASGYNNVFYTPSGYSTVDLTSIKIYCLRTLISDPILLNYGIDYTTELTSTGQAKITFMLANVPGDGYTLTSDFSYQPVASSPITNCILQGDIDGVNRSFNIGPRLLGKRFTFESTEKVDPLYKTQPWRIHFDSSYFLDFLNDTYKPTDGLDSYPRNPPETIRELGRIVLGTKYQLTDSGEVADLYVPLLAQAQDYYLRMYDTSYDDFLLTKKNEFKQFYTWLDQTEVSEGFPISSGTETTIIDVISYNAFKIKYPTNVKTSWDAIAYWMTENSITALTEGQAFTIKEQPGYIYRKTVSPPDTKTTNYVNGIYKFSEAGLAAWSRSRTRFREDGCEISMSEGNISPLLSEMDICATRPVSYTLSISDKGFALFIKGDAHPAGHQGRVICVQRLIDARTSEILTDGLSPVVCLFNQTCRFYQDKINELPTKYPNTGLNTMWQIIVREKDVWAPDTPRIVMSNSEYVNGYWNTKKQISIAEDNSYIITVPDGITTNRHVYYNYRMDMIGFISANVISENMVAKVNMNNEKDETNTKIMREYTATRCTSGYHEASRVLVLTKNGGV